MTAQPVPFQERARRIKEELLELGDMRPGTLSEQYNVCGKPTYRCKDQRDPRKQGPYFQISYSHCGKSTSDAGRR